MYAKNGNIILSDISGRKIISNEMERYKVTVLKSKYDVIVDDVNEKTLGLTYK
jgi:hypothetical protein